jgi:hypothetical protein
MAARVIPFEDNVSAKGISITAADATPEGCILSTTQNAVTFTNNSGYVIDINFNPSGIFTNVIGLSPTPPNNFNTQSAPNNISVNYNVTVYETPQATNGPFAIQTGAGYMQVVVSTIGNEVTCVPDEVAIPLGGNLMLTPATNHDTYPVTWEEGDPFTEPITSVDNTSHTNNPQNGSGEFPYQVGGGPGPSDVPGQGTVIVRGT